MEGVKAEVVLTYKASRWAGYRNASSIDNRLFHLTMLGILRLTGNGYHLSTGGNMRFVRDIARFSMAVMLTTLTLPQEYSVGKDGAGAKGVRDFDQVLSIPQTEHCAHRVGKFWMSVTNWGQFGYEGDGALFPESDCPRSGNRGSTRSTDAEFPGGSLINYLYRGALWIGAIVDDDTLVSVGADGWFFVYEMYPAGSPVSGLEYRSTEPADPNYDSFAVSEFDIVAEYFDTLLDPSYVGLDPYDARSHVPLGLDIVQESYSWSQAEYEDFIMFHFRIRNMGTHNLSDMFFGLYFDCDALHLARRDGYFDDVSGSYKCYDATASESVLVAWSADNDGDPTTAESWDSRSARAVLGVALLDFPTEAQQSFNWWLSWGDDPSLDWSPRRSENDRDFGTGGLGTPVGDRNKYYVMSTPERDYDQSWAAIDQSAQGWLPPNGTQASDLANGSDTRFLLSFGTVDLAPGDSTEFTFVVAMGDNFHRNPTDFQTLFDANDPQAFCNSLDFSDLTTNILAARQLYRRLFVFIPGDVDRSGVVDVTDIVCLLNYLYRGGIVSQPEKVADVNGDSVVTLADAVHLIRYLFRDGPPPVADQ